MRIYIYLAVVLTLPVYVHAQTISMDKTPYPEQYMGYYIYYLKPQKTDGMQFEPDELFERNKVLQVFFVSFIPEEGMLGDSILARYEFTRAALDRCDWTVVYPKEN